MLLNKIIPNTETHFDQAIAEQIWRQKYQYFSAGRIMDSSVEHTWRRVANALAATEPAGLRANVAQTFYEAMAGFRLLPAGRILSGSGTTRSVTLFNTFVMGTVEDSLDGIIQTMGEAARTMKMGGGIGFDFSTIRPHGTPVKGLDCPAAGPVAVMEIADAICKMVASGMGRGAMMGTLACDHPDIEEFVAAKSQGARLNRFNLSVLISDSFMQAVESDAAWPLVWQGTEIRRIGARELWHKIMQHTYNAAEPGVLFIDRINDGNPLSYIETVAATNSCAEQPLPPNGACPLASINLARLVQEPFTPKAAMDLEALADLVATAVRLLDNAIDVSHFPTTAQHWEARNKRRIGVGLTGVGNALIMCDARYGSKKAVGLLDSWMRCFKNAAYRASADLAAERGPFPMFHAAQHMAQPVLRNLDDEVRSKIAAFGLRNGVLTTLAPTGTISMFAGNVSSGIEPVFSTAFNRQITAPDGAKTSERVEDYAALLHRRLFGPNAPLPNNFVTVADLSPRDHVVMQATAQRWIDSGISKTVNCPEDIPFEDFEQVYLDAYRQGCKGCTTYRPNDILGSVLTI
ncbi:MAG: adenosylcobalamin-dependent ribonucleoside-diphosphate reductase [Pseudomonadota bacterium]